MPKNRKITIQQRTAGQAPDGQPITDWVDIGPAVWADIRDVSGREFVAAGAERSEVTTRIYIWRRPDVTAAMRVLRGEVAYEIKAVLEAGRNDTLMMCTKGKP